MIYNETWKASLDFFAVLIIFVAIFHFILKQDKRVLLFYLPLLLCFDIPINQVYHTVKPSLPIRVWHLYVIFIILFDFRFSINALVNIKYFLLFFFIISFCQIIVSQDLGPSKGMLKFVSIYIPLYLSALLFIARLNLKEKFNSLFIAVFVIVLLSFIQIVFSSILDFNLYLLEGFNKPSGTFTEPVWSGIFCAFILLIIFNHKFKDLANLVAVLMLSVLGSKSAILFYLTSRMKLSLQSGISGILLLVGVAFVLLEFNLLSLNNTLESIIVHSGNWFVALEILNSFSSLEWLFGVGLGNANNMIAGQDILTGINTSQFVQIENNIDFERMIGAGDVANIFLDVLLSFGIFGLFVFLYIFYSKLTSYNLNISIFFILISMIHPIYFSGLGVFLFVLLLNDRGFLENIYSRT
jgi:hypothetical protein